MNPNMNRSMLMGVVGGYLIYLAYELIRDMINGVATQMPKALTIIVAVLFAGIGAGLVVFAWKLWKKGREGREEDRTEIPEEESGSEEDQTGPEK